VEVKQPRVQSAHFQCECGASPPVTPLNAYEFEVLCICGKELTLAWAHNAPPPKWEGDIAVPPGPPKLPW
jgi:hypothetical protein